MLRGVLTDYEVVAMKVVELARAELLAAHPFLAPSLGRLRLWPGTYTRPYCCDGEVLGVDALKVLREFRATREIPTADIMHCVLHCLFVHPFVGATINRRLWNLAADIAVEWQVNELCGPRVGTQGKLEAAAFEMIYDRLGRIPTAEVVYHALSEGAFADELPAFEMLFLCDDHAPWYPEKPKTQAEEDDLREDEDAEDAFKGKVQAQAQQQKWEYHEMSEDGQDKAASSPDRGSSVGVDVEAVRTAPGATMLSTVAPGNDFDAVSWRKIMRRAGEELEHVPASRAKGYDSLKSVLKHASPAEMDYREFLRRFAIPGEVMRVSEDEFDYVFYTYGLRLYGNMPLIESLEYRDERRIREFAVVIDTSGSVWGPAVRKFVEVTFDLLKSTESFFSKICLHIIQCDSKVQCDDRITSPDELAQWNRGMVLHGGGGTDFRPAFRYIDDLIAKGEFEHLSGVLYFTDGRGIYPEYVPEYRTAFVFYDNRYARETVPPWAMQVVIGESDLKAKR